MARKSAIKSIRTYCVTVCCAGDMDYVKNCPDGIEHQGKPPRPLYPYRLGSNPNISEESKQKARERLAERGGIFAPSADVGKAKEA